MTGDDVLWTEHAGVPLVVPRAVAPLPPGVSAWLRTPADCMRGVRVRAKRLPDGTMVCPLCGLVVTLPSRPPAAGCQYHHDRR